MVPLIAINVVCKMISGTAWGEKKKENYVCSLFVSFDDHRIVTLLFLLLNSDGIV